MTKMGKVYDFNDFVECVENAKCTPQTMTHKDFRNWTSGASQYRLKKVVPRVYIADIVVAQFRRTSESLYYKYKFEDGF